MIVYIEPTVSTWQGLRVRCDYLLSAPDLFEDRWGQAMQTIDWTDTEDNFGTLLPETPEYVIALTLLQGAVDP